MYVNCRVPLDKAWQVRTLRPHVSDLEENVTTERALKIQVPVLCVGQGQVWRESQVGERSRESSRDRRVPIERIRKVEVERERHLRRLQVRRRADRRLQRPALSGVVRLVEDP